MHNFEKSINVNKDKAPKDATNKTEALDLKQGVVEKRHCGYVSRVAKTPNYIAQ